jgi:hypothetical protein
MKRNSLTEIIERHPSWAKLLHECLGCHAVGLKPGVLNTKLGDYGARQRLSRKYEELPLDKRGLCLTCSKACIDDSDIAKGF